MASICLQSLTWIAYTALLWQKEATDKSPKSEKVVFSLSIFYFHSEFGSETLIPLKDI